MAANMVYNATLNATTAIKSRQSVELLYANTDFSSLNWLEQKWAAWYLFCGDPMIATAVLAFVLHELVYFGRCVPWIIVDAMPFFRRWKLQPTKVPSAKEQWECTKYVLYCHFTVELPLICLFEPVATIFGLSTWQVPFPSWKVMAPQIFFFFVFEDAFHYVAHQFLHYGPMYKNIHKLHHKYSAPFGLAAEYAHPVEVLILGAGTIGGPFLYCMLTANLHILTALIWVTLRLFQAVDAHSGYDFPWSLHNIIPFWSGAEHHDFHHMAFVNNYSTSFRWLDYIFGTDDKYRAYKKRMAAAKAQLKNASKEEHAALEKKMLEETEREGELAEAAAERAGVEWMKSRSSGKKEKVL